MVGKYFLCIFVLAFTLPYLSLAALPVPKNLGLGANADMAGGVPDYYDGAGT
jgi:hypothetical protein